MLHRRGSRATALLLKPLQRVKVLDVQYETMVLSRKDSCDSSLIPLEQSWVLGLFFNKVSLRK